MKTIIYTLPGNPTPLARPRFGQFKVFDKQKLLKINHGLILNHIHEGKSFYKGPLQVNATFFLPIPKRITLKKRESLVGTYQCKRPDIDNYIKYILDIANNILFKDDALISVVHAKKIYDHIPRTVFVIKELSLEKNNKKNNKA